MASAPQNLKNHARLHPIFHLVLVPLFFINVIVAIVVLVRHPGWHTVWGLIMSIALVIFLTIARLDPLKMQDRIIRLEERLRLATLLPDPLRARIPELSEKQLIALRFAPDAEIPALVQKTLSENLKNAEIKKAIVNWRPDTFRV
jgi:hypothetical protein